MKISWTSEIVYLVLFDIFPMCTEFPIAWFYKSLRQKEETCFPNFPYQRWYRHVTWALPIGCKRQEALAALQKPLWQMRLQTSNFQTAVAESPKAVSCAQCQPSAPIHQQGQKGLHCSTALPRAALLPSRVCLCWSFFNKWLLCLNQVEWLLLLVNW